MFAAAAIARNARLSPRRAGIALVTLALNAQPVCALAAPADSGWEGPARLIEAPDLNPDPRIVEINLEARIADVETSPGQHVPAWTYNGGLPGPLIKVHVGDRLIVHFTNSLPQPTTVHWHGLRIPIQMDGVPGVSQPDVKPGGTFTYDFVVPDAGLYWYHPHVMSAAQVGFGLYGALLVEDPKEPVSGLDEVVIVLSDIDVDEKGALEDPETGGSTGMAFGREGNRVLVNGREQPTLIARAGVPQRWRIVNAAKSRYYELDPDGMRFRTVGGDAGLQDAPVDSDTIVIAPGERIDTIVTPRPKTGDTRVVDYRLFNRGYGSVEARVPIVPLFTLRFEGGPATDAPPIPDLRRPIAPLSTAGAKDVRVELTIDQRGDGSFEYGINGVPFQKDHPFTARPGETQIWTLVNSTSWSHPFHIHGFFFQVLDEKGGPVRPLAWKDTVNVPFKSTVRIAVHFDDDRPGAWMFHCHVLDHADGGLMGTVLVGVPVPEAAPAHVH
jgi:FtsP/CotA-like multicopper oxidase with cupredoxin domain